MKRIAIFTSGGDAPGMNAAIRAAVRTAKFHGIETYGIMNGYQGMIEGRISKMDTGAVANILQRGGTVLKTARSEEFRTKDGRQTAYNNLKELGIEGCVAIGGNGTYTGAHIFSQEHNMPFIGIPGTIDNDIYGTNFSIGFDTAINTAIEAIDKIRDTADSHNRLFFIEVMGRHSGYIALYTGIGSGAGNIFLPEEENSIEHLMEQLEKSAKRNKLFNLVIVAEGNKNGGAIEIAEKVNAINQSYDSRVTIIGHLQRGGSPTCNDRVLASRLGNSAVDALRAGKRDLAVGIMDNKIKFTPFDEAISKENTLNEELIRMAEILAL